MHRVLQTVIRKPMMVLKFGIYGIWATRLGALCEYL